MPLSAFTAAGFSPFFYDQVKYIAHDEEGHVVALAAGLQQAGYKPNAACTYAFPMTTPKQFIQIAAVVEGLGVSAYLGGAPLISNKVDYSPFPSLASADIKSGLFDRCWCYSRHRGASSICDQIRPRRDPNVKCVRYASGSERGIFYCQRFHCQLPVQQCCSSSHGLSIIDPCERPSYCAWSGRRFDTKICTSCNLFRKWIAFPIQKILCMVNYSCCSAQVKYH